MKKERPARTVETALAVLVWILVWQIASIVISQEMLLAAPLAVAGRLISLLPEASFWARVGYSLSRVGAGFLTALFCGSALAALSYRLRAVRVLMSPLMSIAKATPVASYIILCLLFMSSRSLSAFCSFLMALPVVYTNVLGGLQSTDQRLLEMASAFGMSAPRKILYIYFSQLMPFLISACSLSLGLCWKAGIAAEVIGLPLGSIGERLYQAKVFLDSKSLLAWTIVIVAVSFLLERAFLALLQRLSEALERL